MPKKTVAVRLTPSVWEAFKQSAKHHDRSAASWLERLMVSQIAHDGIEIDA